MIEQLRLTGWCAACVALFCLGMIVGDLFADSEGPSTVCLDRGGS